MKTKKQIHPRTSHYNLYQILFLMGWPIIIQILFIWFQRRSKQKSIRMQN